MSTPSWDKISGDIRRLQAKTSHGTGKLTEKILREALARSGTPRKVGDGEAAFVAQLEIDYQPFIWDSNCFYRRLGLDPRCERVEIARAFGELDPLDPRFSWYATAARVLLKKHLRASYDRLPLGAFWSDDPDLFDSKMEHLEEGGVFVSPDDPWSIYADPSVTDEEALSIDPAWRSMLVDAVVREAKRHYSDLTFYIGLGATSAMRNSRWEQVGYVPVLFVPIDSVASREYVERAAEYLIRTATPVST